MCLLQACLQQNKSLKVFTEESSRFALLVFVLGVRHPKRALEFFHHQASWDALRLGVRSVQDSFFHSVEHDLSGEDSGRLLRMPRWMKRFGGVLQ